MLNIGVIKDIKFVKGEFTAPYEYLCGGCGQLRISFVASDKCANCGSSDIVKGKIGTLEKPQNTKGEQNV